MKKILLISLLIFFFIGVYANSEEFKKEGLTVGLWIGGGGVLLHNAQNFFDDKLLDIALSPEEVDIPQFLETFNFSFRIGGMITKRISILYNLDLGLRPVIEEVKIIDQINRTTSKVGALFTTTVHTLASQFFLTNRIFIKGGLGLAVTRANIPISTPVTEPFSISLSSGFAFTVGGGANLMYFKSSALFVEFDITPQFYPEDAIIVLCSGGLGFQWY